MKDLSSRAHAVSVLALLAAMLTAVFALQHHMAVLSIGQVSGFAYVVTVALLTWRLRIRAVPVLISTALTLAFSLLVAGAGSFLVVRTVRRAAW